MSVSVSYSLVNGSVGGSVPIVTLTAGASISISTAIPSATTVTIPCDHGTIGALKGIYLNAEAAPVHVRTNSVTGDQQLQFIPNTPLVWATSMPNSCPITTAITAGLVCVNTSTTTVTFSGNLVYS